MTCNGWCAGKSAIIFLLYFSCLGLVIYLSDHTISSYNLYPSLISSCKIFVLNLDYCKDRMEYIRNMLDKEGIKFERVSAIDGRSLSFYDVISTRHWSAGEVCENNMLKNKRFWIEHRDFPESGFLFDYRFRRYYRKRFRYRYVYKVSLGELGCYYSHRIIWQKILDRGLKYALILEDDARISRYFPEYTNEILKSMPLDADFILLERRERAGPLVEVSNTIEKSRTPRGRKLVFTGTCGYVVTNQGARKLLDATREASIPIDLMIPMSYLDNKINHYVAKKAPVAHNRNFDSIITGMGRIAWNEIREKNGRKLLNQVEKRPKRRRPISSTRRHRRLRRLKAMERLAYTPGIKQIFGL